MSERISLYLQDNLAFPQAIDAVKYAEARGFETVWQAETRFVRDSLVTLAAFASVTTRIKLGCGVVNHWSRNIGTLASELLTLDDIASDRIICGLGSWSDTFANKVGIQRVKPLLAMRETITVLRRLLAMERVTFRGEIIHVTDLGLDVQFGLKEPRAIPLYVGATGAMLSVAGEVADGVLLNYLVPSSYTAQAIEQVYVGVRKSGRPLQDIQIPQLIMCSVHADRQKALDVARKVVTQAIIQQPQLMRANGVSQDLVDELAQVSPSNDYAIQEVMRLVPDSVVQLLTASGSPTDVRAKVSEYMRAGATIPVLYSLGDDVRLLIDTFANGYSESVRY